MIDLYTIHLVYVDTKLTPLFKKLAFSLFLEHVIAVIFKLKFIIKIDSR